MSGNGGSLLQPVITDKAPTPGAQYTQALSLQLSGAVKLVFISGQGPVDSDSQPVGVGDIDAQVRQTFANIQALLDAAGGGLEHLAEMTIYLRDINDRPAVTKVRQEVLARPYPTATMVEIKDFASPDWMIEISGLAVLPV